MSGLTSRTSFISAQQYLRCSQFPELDIFACTYRVDRYRDSLFQDLGIIYEDSLGNAVIKRRAEFLAGRFCARNALLKQGILNYHVKVGEGRRAIWPEGVIGSITHTRDSAICVAAQKGPQSVLGIDREEWIDESSAKQIYTQILSAKELRVVNTLELRFHKALTIVFSAKESFFKAYYAQAGQYFGFDEAELIAARCGTTGGVLTLKPSAFIAHKAKTKGSIKIHYRIRGNGVTTLHYK